MERQHERQSEQVAAQPRVYSRTPCATCKGSGLLTVAKFPTLTAELCLNCSPSDYEQRSALEEAATRIAAANIPSGFKDAILDADTPTAIKDWLQTPDRGLFLFGPSGSQKTEKAIALLFEFLKQGKAVKYFDCSEYMMDRRASYGARGIGSIGDVYTEKTERLRHAIQTYDVVVIDNIGVGTVNEWTISNYDQLLTSRSNTGRLTIYVSNYTEDRLTTHDGNLLSARVGKRAAKRILSATGVQCTEMASREEPNAQIINFAEIRCGRTIEQDETTFLHIWAREGLFRLISTRDRSDFTRISEIDPNEVIEVTDIREYVSWSGYHIIIDGPVLDYDDANVLAAILHLHHRRNDANGEVIMTLSELARTLNLKSSSGSVQRSLKRSLMRLAKCRPTIISQKEQKPIWVGGFIDSVLFEGRTRNAHVRVHLNRSMIPLYKKNAFTFLKLPILTGVSQYAQGMYRFLVTQREAHKFIGLEKWKTILGVRKDLDEKWFRRCMRNAMDELIKNRILIETSSIDRNGIVNTYLASNVQVGR